MPCDLAWQFTLSLTHSAEATAVSHHCLDGVEILYIIAMRSVHDSVETVNAAATAIVAAEARVQPFPVQKRRWGGWWSMYWCFGSYKHSKRIGHTLVISQETVNGVSTSTCYAQNPNPTSTTTPSFAAPPSTPTSYLPSNSPSPTLLPLSSLSVHPTSPELTAHIFLIGPYADETQLVSPPVFSSFTTQPSSAPLTPPPEAVQMTTPSSPEAPFAQLLSSSLAQKWRNSRAPSPFYDKRADIDLPMVEAPKFVGYEHFMNYKWGSRLGSGALTPNGKEPPSQECNILENNQNFEVVESENNHRVSFELRGEEIPISIMKETTKGKDLATEVALSFQTQTSVRSDDGRDRTASFGSSKDFNFNNTNDEVAIKELGPQKNWTFFPMLQSGGS